MSATDRILDKLGTSKQVRDGYRAKCPAHDGKSADSLSLRQVEGQALLYCHAGCAAPKVLEALGLTLRDLYDEPRGATYTYTDRTGSPTRTVHRSPEKRFRQTGDTKGRPQLYRLPQVLEAVAEGRPVYVVEGEKDVHAIESVGGVATTSPMGASNWPKVDASPLYGAHVVIVPDNDTPGDTYLRDVLTSLHGKAESLLIARARAGKDAADHIAAGHGLDELEPDTTIPEQLGERRLVVTRASSITIRPVHWLWADRVPLGSLALLAGREGIGKSTVAYQLAADLTRGVLPGRHQGSPKGVIVAATEDSWEHTIVPRLMAAGADLDRVLRVDVVTSLGTKSSLTLPKDTDALASLIPAEDVGLVLLDPLMSRLDSKLDSHKDAEVRVALEPITDVADKTGAAVLGIIHVNKGRGADALDRIMGSKAFPAVARSVLFVMKDPDDDELRLLGTPKNNLGRTDTLPTLTFSIDSAKVADTDEGPVWTGKIQWRGEVARSIDDALESSEDGTDARSATQEAGEWLVDFLTSQGGESESSEVKKHGTKAGHSADALKRARRACKVDSRSHGFPRTTVWFLPALVQSEQASQSIPGESAPTALTTPTAPTEDQSVQSVQWEGSPETALTDEVCELCASTPATTAPGERYPYCGRCRAGASGLSFATRATA